MTVRYLLPCSCGAKIPIEPRQAGEEIQCECGASLEIPTLMKMAELELAEPEPAASAVSGTWGTPQGLMLLGAMISVLALVLGAFSLRSRPEPPITEFPTELIGHGVDTLSPLETWHRWQYLRSYGLDPTPFDADRNYAKRLLKWRLKMGAILAVVAGGIALMVIPALTKGRPKSGDR